MSVENDLSIAKRIAAEAAQRGGAVYFVGGFVRDRLCGRENKDVDIEVHGIAPAALEEILDSIGQRIAVGQSFGIYGIKGCSLDIAMPRKEACRGKGHKDFDILVDPFIGTYKAAIRRDFTVNAMMENVLTGEIVDHFGGQKDLRNGILRHVNDDTFAEDPLRVLRAAQFAARFGYTIAPETVALCRGMDLTGLSRERITGELEKALLKADRPSVFFEALRGMDQLSYWFPELERTIGIRQSAKHHAEGDVYTHTMMVVDAAAAYRGKVEKPFGFMLTAVTHDFGKILCTEEKNGEIHAYGHEEAGLPLIRSFLSRLTNEKALTRYVLNLAEYHMKPYMLALDGASVKSTNRMFDRSVDPDALVYFAFADGLGKIPPRDPSSLGPFLTERLKIYRDYMARPYISGQDLIAAGVSPSKNFTGYLSFAHKLRLAGVKKENMLAQTLALARKNGDLTAAPAEDRDPSPEKKPDLQNAAGNGDKE